MDRAAPERPMARPGSSTHRVVFSHPLANVAVVSPTAPLPPFRRPAEPTAVQSSEPVPPPADFDLAKELRADRARIQAVLDQFRTATADLRSRQAGDMDQLREVAVTLALTIASRVFHRAVTAGEFPLEQIAYELTAQLVNEEPARVRLNPDDLALLTERLDGQPLLPAGDPKVVADQTLARGTVAVDGTTQTLRADPVRTLNDIRDEMMRSIAHVRS